MPQRTHRRQRGTTDMRRIAHSTGQSSAASPPAVSTSEQYLTERELAERWRITVKALQQWRLLREGPTYCKLGRSVRYPLSEVLRFEQMARVTPVA